MRICIKHRKNAVETLKSYKTGTEYDLCAICVAELEEILEEKIDKAKSTEELAKIIAKESKRGRKRTA